MRKRIFATLLSVILVATSTYSPSLMVHAEETEETAEISEQEKDAEELTSENMDEEKAVTDSTPVEEADESASQDPSAEEVEPEEQDAESSEEDSTVDSTKETETEQSLALGTEEETTPTITLSDNTLSFEYQGQEATLTAYVDGIEVENTDLTWISSDESVAIVEEGVVTAIQSGTTTITAAKDGATSATCEATVNIQDEPAPIDNVTSGKELTFTANEANSWICFNWSSGSDVQYNKNSEGWKDYAAGTQLDLNSGDSLSLRGTDVCTDWSNYFTMGGNISASGDVTSLTNQIGGDVSLSETSYKNMFRDCTSLTTAPSLPSTTISDSCYNCMFYGCTSLTTAPSLPATTISDYCYTSMFYGCTSLTTAPSLPAKIMYKYCYAYMFKNCSGLLSVPSLPVTILDKCCYYEMFCGCSSLKINVNGPGIEWIIPADADTDDASNWNYNMFSKTGGTFTGKPELGKTYYDASLIIAVEGVALDSSSIELNVDDSKTLEASVEPSNASDSSLTWATSNEKVATVDSDGKVTAIASGKATITVTTADGGKTATCEVIVSGEQIDNELTFTANQDNSWIKFNWSSGSDVQYNKNNSKWMDYTAGTQIDLNTGDTVGFRGTDVCTDGSNHFQMKGSISADGDVTSLTNQIGGDATLTDWCYQYMFYNCTALNQAPSLPATTLAKYCYSSMFAGCSKLISTPELPALTMAFGCYDSMFSWCTGLTSAPLLSSEILAPSCYSSMFNHCTKLASAPQLPADSTEYSCYSNMFSHCTALTSAPELPATSLESCCYAYMFTGCTSLSSAPVLPATSVADNCYFGMFCDCTGLLAAPNLPATTMDYNCYGDMFNGCTGLTSVPDLPATTLAQKCYYEMFKGCTNLTSVPDLPATTLAQECYCGMFYGCSSLKISRTSPGLKWTIPTDATTASDWNTGMFSGTGGKFTGAPEAGITYYIASEKKVFNELTFTAIDDGPIVYFAWASGSNVQYNINNSGWIDYTAYLNVKLNRGDSVSFRGSKVRTSSDSHFYMGGRGSIAVSGDVTSLTNQEGGDAQLSDYCYSYMFCNCTAMISAPELPSTTLAPYCYQYMFCRCTGLTTAPTLPATNLAESCYSNMFNSCTTMTSAPELASTTLAPYCYQFMFTSCHGLISAPDLPATILADHCYFAMFYYCTELKTAPNLPATKLAENCYDTMFAHCDGLISTPDLLSRGTLSAEETADYFRRRCRPNRAVSEPEARSRRSCGTIL